MKFYIATTLTNAHRAEAIALELEAAGHVVTYKWFEHGGVGDQGRVVLAATAAAELQGVKDADAVIVLLPGGRGTHAELGMALALGKPCIVWDEPGEAFRQDNSTCAFYWHRLVYKGGGSLEHLAMRQALVEVARGWASNYHREQYGHAGALLATVRRSAGSAL